MNDDERIEFRDRTVLLEHKHPGCLIVTRAAHSDEIYCWLWLYRDDGTFGSELLAIVTEYVRRNEGDARAFGDVALFGSDLEKHSSWLAVVFDKKATE